ncbi:beta-N-acetylhexosaminidase [Velocimicrobium porci]|uniref:beta-N-acetylhexosaminidase n=1 Tax=Velocimicrobium porci TaxID=2606634 RepID=A0A6L5XWU0_9FIRM|nr:glycoside hydrolase family 20 zincin-like fold domain-containing protein [Velocimicrobium porci]MSS63079.1 family 20 glycosylhydrolase [Velocimicrobium porci]
MYLIPQPKKITKIEGVYRIRYQDHIMIDSNCGSSLDEYAKILKQEIEQSLGFSLMIKRGKKKQNGIYFSICKEYKEQEYMLKVNTEGIEIAAGSDTGVLYGVQTLRQIVRQNGTSIPYLTIFDEPAILNRGFYHDVTRGRVPKLSYLKWLADKLAFYKMNQLQLYIEHSFLFEDFSEVWRDDTPLTAEEIMELDRYCSRIGIELVPSISCFGHLYKILSTKSYSHLCELEEPEKEPFSFLARMQHHTIDVSNENSLEFIKKMIEEFLPLFSSSQFNICADETFDLGKGKSKVLAGQIGRDRMYLNYVKELCEFLVEKGKRPMFWGDIICGFPEAIKELPKETICLNWGYAPNQRELESKKLHEVGATQYSCPGVGGWNQFINLIDSSYENIKRMCTYAEKYNSLGVLNTDWGDFGHINQPQFSITGLIYGAAFSWNTDIPSKEMINRQISYLEFGDSTESFVSLIAKSEKYRSFEWEGAVRYMELSIQGASEEEKELYFKEVSNLSNVAENNIELEQLVNELYESISFMNIETRKGVKPYIVAAEGMILFNQIGAIIGKREYGINSSIEVKEKELAVILENWFYHYKQLWRLVSKESELYRIQAVINWYADYLRK